jgi:hypothetical protein
MLRQEKYIGIWRFKETQWVNEPGTNRRIARKRPPDEMMVAERPELRIIDADLWTDVQSKLAESTRGRKKRPTVRRSRYLLSGIIVCDECGLQRRGSEAATGVAEELREIEARSEADRAAIVRLKLEAIDGTGLPDPDEITAQAFRVQEVLAGDIFRARHALSRWLKDGQIRVRPAPTGFELQGAFYPLLTVKRPEKEKPKDRRPLGSQTRQGSSGGGIQPARANEIAATASKTGPSRSSQRTKLRVEAGQGSARVNLPWQYVATPVLVVSPCVTSG